MTHCVVTPTVMVNVKESIPGNISRWKSPMGQSAEEARLLGKCQESSFSLPALNAVTSGMKYLRASPCWWGRVSH